jgi:Uma2 family endonuclease
MAGAAARPILGTLTNVMPRVAVQRVPLLTAEDFFDLDVPDEKTELVDGKVLRTGPAGGEHGVIALRIGAWLLMFVEQHQLGVVCAAETGFLAGRDPDTVRAPDAAFISRERMGEGRPPKKFWPVAPDLAVEVVSPSERAEQVQERVRDWFAAGARAVWMLFPGTATVHAYRSPSDVRILQRGDLLTGEGDLLPGFSCAMADLFR